MSDSPDGEVGPSQQSPAVSLPGLGGGGVTIDQIVFVQHDDLRQHVREQKIDLGILGPEQSESGRLELIQQKGDGSH